MVAFHQLPRLKGKRVIRALEKGGFLQDRQKGSHVVMRNPITKFLTVVPVHGGEEISKPLLMDIIKQAGLNVEQFVDLL